MAKQESTLVLPQAIVGLGNPTAKYAKTRHNVGFDAIDALARSWQVSLAENKRFRGIFGEGNLAGSKKVYLLQPTTYMNHSGRAMRALADWYKLSPASILVVYDDMDLPVGKIRLRLGGSAGGHNGMKSAIAHLGTQQFPRLRVGIGKPQPSTNDKETVSHVLGKFSPSEKQIVCEVMDLVVGAIEVCLREGVEKAMNAFNNRSVALAESRSREN